MAEQEQLGKCRSVDVNRRLRGAGVQAATNAGMMTLRDTVSLKTLSDEAEKLAAAVYGVHDVRHEIKGESMKAPAAGRRGRSAARAGYRRLPPT